MKAEEKVLYEKRDRVAIVTLNRPEAKNAVDPEMDVRLAEIWREFAADESLDVAIWTGSEDAFCAGADRNTWLSQWVDADSLSIRASAVPVVGRASGSFSSAASRA